MLDLIQAKNQLFLYEKGIDLEAIQDEMVSEGKTISFEKFRLLKKNEKVIKLFLYKNHENSQIPIFELEDDTFWTICEIGLTQYKFEIIGQNKFKIESLHDVLPINQFNPRPGIESPWNYELDLKKTGLKMIASKENMSSPFK
jgi:hypothetical protein